MAPSPFALNPVPLLSPEVEIAPVLNMLTSLSFLHRIEHCPDPAPWLQQQAASLSPEMQAQNRLVFEGLGRVLLAVVEEEEFPAALKALAALPPEQIHALLPQGAASRASERLPQDDAFHQALLAVAADPERVRHLLIDHLTALWEGGVADEWRRSLPPLKFLRYSLSRRAFAPAPALDLVNLFLGHEAPSELVAQLGEARTLVFVLSPHLGGYGSNFGNPGTLWVFVRARAETLPLRQVPIKRVELLNPFQALADETRLHILELMAQQPEGLLAQEILGQLDLSQPSISRHLKQLVSTGFLAEQRGEGANKRYQLRPERIDWLFRAFKEVLAGSEPVEPTSRDEHPAELRPFLDDEGRVVQWPSKRKNQELVLEYLAGRFQREHDYREAEVNALLNQWHTWGDPAYLRRLLFETERLCRTPDGSRYWMR